MKNIIDLSLVLTIVICVIFFYFTQESRDWDFIQKVGGIKTESLLETEDGLYLPVICNISGTDSITIKPTQINSALVCRKIHVKRVDSKIYLTVITGPANSGTTTCNCKAVNIGDLDKGIYIVYYIDKSSAEHQIGQFDLKNER